jgi:signal transduction histidine kinase/CheY-like chemotaxis protein
VKYIKGLFLCLLIAVLLSNSSLAETTEPNETSKVNTNIIQLTQAEKEFIDKHPVINLGVDPKFVPYEFIDSDGVYKGISADYIDLISQKTGLKFVVSQDLTWSEAYEKAVEKELDVLPCIAKTTQREQHFLFSDAYLTFQRVIFLNENNNDIKSLDDLKGSTVAVQTNSSHHNYLSSFENIKLSLYTDVEEALQAVSDGTESAFVGNLATSSYLTKSFGITNLRYIAIDTEEPQALYFAVRNDWPELAGIINKALSHIDEEDKIAINNKWIGIEKSVDYSEIIKIAAIIGSIIAVILSVSFFWIIRLRKEIEKRKKIQSDLEKARKDAEDANKFKSNFMARMSHEIRTPLNAITGMSYLLKKTNVTLTQKMYIDRITQASTNMLSIINDILDFSKIEAGKVNLEYISFNLDQVIQDVVNIISYKIEEQEIGFKLSKDPTVPNWFFGDAKRIEQILINILNNSAKFTSSGEVSLDIRLIAREAEKYHLAFTVKDTGIGMSEEQVKNLFEPFTQADISINRRFGGTGLGLSIVKNLVEMMNGQIQVYSTEGDGSTFIIHLSLEIDKANEDEYKKTIAADHFKNVKTLVLEKTGSNMNMIESYLSSFGMDCELTTSQVSALIMLEAANGKFAKSFDLLIVDYETPAEGGFKFVEAIRNNKKITKVPKIIMLLPMMREDLFDKLDEYNINIGIGKPIIPSILFNGILDIFKLKAVAVTKFSEDEDNSTISLDYQNCVLVVEDNKTNQLIAKSLLQQAGLQVLIASDGKEGLEIFSEHRSEINLILMDLHMPVMNGYEAAIEIRKISDNVPIVAMTADVILGVKEKCEQSGIYNYISKPFDPDRFIQTVKSIIKQSEASDFLF